MVCFYSVAAFASWLAVMDRSSAMLPYPSVIPAGFVSTVTTNEDGSTQSAVQIQFVDMATGDAFTSQLGPAGTASQIRLIDQGHAGSRITRIDTPPIKTSVSAASLAYQPSAFSGSGLVDSGVGFRVQGPLHDFATTPVDKPVASSSLLPSFPVSPDTHALDISELASADTDEIMLSTLAARAAFMM